MPDAMEGAARGYLSICSMEVKPRAGLSRASRGGPLLAVFRS